MPSLVVDVRSTLAGLDSQIPLYRSHSMETTIERLMSVERMLARLLGVLAILAAALSATGLFAVVAWTVSERTREIGIRISMGADPKAVIGWVVRRAVGLGLVGLAFGALGSAWIARMLESRLYGVAALDPGTWMAAAGLLMVVTLAAAAQPAVHAAAIRPVEALRAE